MKHLKISVLSVCPNAAPKTTGAVLVGVGLPVLQDVFYRCSPCLIVANTSATNLSADYKARRRALDSRKYCDAKRRLIRASAANFSPPVRRQNVHPWRVRRREIVQNETRQSPRRAASRQPPHREYRPPTHSQYGNTCDTPKSAALPASGGDGNDMQTRVIFTQSGAQPLTGGDGVG